MGNEILMEPGAEQAIAILSGVYLFTMFLSLVLNLVIIFAMWGMFKKAGHEGWKALIPIYNWYLMFEIIYGQGWKMFLLLVPVLSYIVVFAYPIRMAQAYGKSVGFGIANIFFMPVTMCMLGFGGSDYEGPINSFI